MAAGMPLRCAGLIILVYFADQSGSKLGIYRLYTMNISAMPFQVWPSLAALSV